MAEIITIMLHRIPSASVKLLTATTQNIVRSNQHTGMDPHRKKVFHLKKEPSR